jgi:diacylglycerol kinase family enzyme
VSPGRGGARLVMVVNPTASSVSPRRLAEVKAALSASHRLEVIETERRDHATQLAREAAHGGADAVVVLGGDGTQNEAANGLVGTDSALAVLPGGSTNVFARTLGFPNDTIEACTHLLDLLARRSIRRVGLGSANGRYFLFHTGMGFDAAVVAQVERRSGLKKRIGQAAFVYAGIATWSRHFDRRKPLLSVDADGDGGRDAFMVVCLNTNPYTFLGKRPLDIAPDTTLDTGLAVVSLHTVAFLPLLSVLGSAIGLGRPVREHPGVSYLPDLGKVTVRGRAPFPYQVDGDHLGDTPEVHLRHEPDRLALVVP